MKKTLLTIGVVLIVSLVGWRIWNKVGEASTTAAGAPGGGGGRGGPVPVVAMPVRTETIRDVRQFTGTLRAQSEYVVAPKLNGRLEALTVRLGEPVTRGQLLAELDSEEHVRRLEQAQAERDVAKANAEKVRLDALLEDEEFELRVLQVEAELGIAKANVEERTSSLTVAQREFERAQALRGKTIMSQASLDEAEARYLAEKARTEVAKAQVVEKEAALKSARVRLSEVHATARQTELLLAQAQVAQKEAAVKAAEVQLAYTRIHADWEGDDAPRYVAERFVDAGTMLTSNTPIIRIVDIQPLRAFIYVIERDYPLIKVGQEASITTDAYPGERFSGRVAHISQVLQETSRQALVEVEIPNADQRLKPGMFVRLDMEFSRQDNATVVPRSAVVSYNDRQGVFWINETEGTATFVPVKTGIISVDSVEILEPSLEGSVVTLGHHLLSDGVKVLISSFSDDPAATKE